MNNERDFVRIELHQRGLDYLIRDYETKIIESYEKGLLPVLIDDSRGSFIVRFVERDSKGNPSSWIYNQIPRVPVRFRRIEDVALLSSVVIERIILDSPLRVGLRFEMYDEEVITIAWKGHIEYEDKLITDFTVKELMELTRNVIEKNEEEREKKLEDILAKLKVSKE